MSLFQVDNPDLGSIAVRLPGSNTQFDRFLSYEFSNHFLTPSDAFWFELDQDELSDNDKKFLVPGAGVEVSVQDQRQCSGFVDAINRRTGHGGTVWRVECRDWLSLAVDGHVDPQQQFSSTSTLQQFLLAVLSPFLVDTIVADNVANRNVITGRVYGNPTNLKGSTLKKALAHQIKPYPREGAFAFACRVAQRFGVWLWPGQKTGTIICSVPDFNQDPRYQLLHRQADVDAGNNNIIEGNVTESRRDQPSILIGYGTGGGGDFAKTTLRAFCTNPVILADNSKIIGAYPTAFGVTVPAPAAATPTITGNYSDIEARPLYLYDAESHNQDELTHFLLRELSLKMRASLLATYVIEGHRLGGQVVAVDTMMRVDDDRSNLHMTLWVLSRHFSKHPGEGTRTRLELIRPGTIVF